MTKITSDEIEVKVIGVFGVNSQLPVATAPHDEDDDDDSEDDNDWEDEDDEDEDD